MSPEPHSGDRLRRQYSFGEFTLDVEHRLLRRGGDEVTLRPKSFDVLAHLVKKSRGPDVARFFSHLKRTTDLTPGLASCVSRRPPFCLERPRAHVDVELELGLQIGVELPRLPQRAKTPKPLAEAAAARAHDPDLSTRRMASNCCRNPASSSPSCFFPAVVSR